ncbi:MAG: hypothetical protein R2867_45865 [Caldilineaceae bacterium]
MATSASASATRIFEIIDTPNEIVEAADAVALAAPRGEVEFADVSFGYGKDGRSVLRGLVSKPVPARLWR